MRYRCHHVRDYKYQPVNPIQMTQDRDPDMGSEFFETRQAFLSLCQGNHYQFDSLRRAKHSSMMVLYHLHNPEAPAFSSTCNFCHVEIEPGTGLRCTVCSDFDMCKNCKQAGMRHEHPMVVSGWAGFVICWQAPGRVSLHILLTIERVDVLQC
jgi:E1A/CREB-binding protein